MSIAARLVTGEQTDCVWTWCPGCDILHPFRIRSDDPELDVWEWDGNLERPTFAPSLLVFHSVHLCEGEHQPQVCPDYDACDAIGHIIGHEIDGVLTWKFPHGVPDHAGPPVYGHGTDHTREPAFGPCHSFLRDGRWEFLNDSAHHLAGQTVDMVDLPFSRSGEDS